MNKVIIYHNPRCTKSRQALQLLQEKNIEPEIIEYLQHPPSKKRLKELLAMLHMSARELMRKTEIEYKELGLDDKSLTETQLIAAMVENPKLIERPIVINKNKAIVGRPPEKILEIL